MKRSFADVAGNCKRPCCSKLRAVAYRSILVAIPELEPVVFDTLACGRSEKEFLECVLTLGTKVYQRKFAHLGKLLQASLQGDLLAKLKDESTYVHTPTGEEERCAAAVVNARISFRNEM